MRTGDGCGHYWGRNSEFCVVVGPDTKTAGSGLVVARLPAEREGPGSNRAADKSLCFHENHCDTQLWTRAAHLLQCLGRLSLPPSEGR